MVLRLTQARDGQNGSSRAKMHENTPPFAPRLEQLTHLTTSTPQTPAQSPHSSAKSPLHRFNLSALGGLLRLLARPSTHALLAQVHRSAYVLPIRMCSTPKLSAGAPCRVTASAHHANAPLPLGRSTTSLRRIVTYPGSAPNATLRATSQLAVRIVSKSARTADDRRPVYSAVFMRA